MEHDLAKHEALDLILSSLITELEAAIDMAVLPPMMQKFGELLTRCTNATALAKAGQTLNARGA